MIDWIQICRKIALRTGISIDASQVKVVGGGCISSAYLVGLDKHQQVFIKTSRKDSLKMFQAEAAGLAEMAKAGAIIIPAIYSTGLSGNVAYIAMQALQLYGSGDKNAYRNFGRQLARLHRYHVKQYGAAIDNTIGATYQSNTWHKSWIDFWRTNRLGFQLNLAKQNGAQPALIDDGLRLSEQMDALFESEPASACLHGDLWQGNWGFNQDGLAVIFDPAHYFGDRETDIAMTKLFGSAHPDFYASYHDTYPMRPNYSSREIFYNIYHILNHYNLFGGGYANQAHQMIQQTLSELR